jgi:hypothetical protein
MYRIWGARCKDGGRWRGGGAEGVGGLRGWGWGVSVFVPMILTGMVKRAGEGGGGGAPHPTQRTLHSLILLTWLISEAGVVESRNLRLGDFKLVEI